MLRTHVIGAVFKRNVASYFSGVLGYLFIVVFVIVGALFAFRAEFFSHNLANLDQLSEYFPYLLLFLVPAITMTAWAEERKLGTDELLFTLPATDLEIILGKYLAVLAVYSIALAFSMTHSLVLAWLGSTSSFWHLSWLGSPDWGMLLTTYFGYWLAGAALLSAGMFASSLTSSATVAFVAGVVICGVPVFMDRIPHLPDALEQLTLREQFRDFAMGVVPLSGLLYFVSLTAFMLYLNVVMIGRRHWSTIESTAPPRWLDGCIWLVAAAGFAAAYFLQPVGTWYDIALCAFAAITLYTLFAFLLGPAPGRHYAGRVVALAGVLISWNYMATYADTRLDMTEENLFTLSATTDRILDEIPKDRTVMIDAYVSPEVPDEYQEVRRQLLGLLRQIDRRGGSKVRVRIVDVEPYSETAEEASNWGIEARPVQSERGGRFLVEDIYLGAVVRGTGEVVIPFFDVGNSVEYQLTRSIGTVSQEERMTVGILTTDAKVMGGFDMQTYRSQPVWRIADELKKQYVVEEVSPDAPIDADKFEVLIAVLPSSLTEEQMGNLVNYVESGGATLIFDDPVPYLMLQNAPLLEKPRQGGGQMGFQGYSEPKADGGRLTTLLDSIRCSWELNRPGDVNADGSPKPAGVNFVLLDAFNPHPEFSSEIVGPEWVFVTNDSDVTTALNPNSPITSELQEVLTYYPGSIQPRRNSDLEFTPLLRSSKRLSGLADWEDIYRDSPLAMFGIPPQVVRNPRFAADSDSHVIAAWIRSDEDADDGLNVIFACDTDMISDAMFQMQERQQAGLHIDNTTFVLNAVDMLAGNTDYLELRNRRPGQHRLKRVEARKLTFQETLNQQINEAENDAKVQLEEAQKRLDAKVEEIENDQTLDARQQNMLLSIARDDEQKKLDLQREEVEQEKEQEIRSLRAQTERDIREIENGVWGWAVFLPALPAIVLGAVVLVIRLMNEQSTISPDRLVRR